MTWFIFWNNMNDNYGPDNHGLHAFGDEADAMEFAKNHCDAGDYVVIIKGFRVDHPWA